MMTKEEYKENVIRMWDSLREDEYKGKEYCEGVACGDCPLYKKACGSLFAFEAIEFAEKWAKDHPIKTNADKFKEIFGVEAPMNKCIKNYDFCADCECYEFGSEHGGCKANERFWNAEYKEQKRKVQKMTETMKDYRKYINALRKCAKEHENDRVFTGHVIVSDLCRDTADLLETMEQKPCEEQRKM